MQPGSLHHNGVIAALARHAGERGRAEAIGEIGGARCTYAELAELVEVRARRLRSCVEPGGVVIAVLPAGVEYVAWFCAALAAGVRLLAMHPQIAGPEALGVAERAGAVAAVVGAGMVAEGALRHLAFDELEPTRHPHPPAQSSGHLLPRSRAKEGSELGAIVLGSSGTTGLPKLALREAASLEADGRGVIEGLRLTERDRVVFVTPLSHSYGVDVLAGTLMAGACLRVCSAFDAELVAGELEGGATVLPGVPFVFEALARRARTRAASLRVAVSAGSPLPERVRRGFFEAWSIEVGQLYGSTELGAVTIDMPGMAGFDAASVGRPLSGVSVRVVDVDEPRRVLGAGEEGQLVVRAGSMLSAYLDGEVPLVDGHFLTGDLARIAADGRVTITGRLKMLVDVGAYKVNPLEVEGVLCAHPRVAECVVTGVAASETVQRLRAVVVARDVAEPPTADELRRFVRDRLSAIKVPRTVEFAASLPKTATGKVMRDRV